MPRPPCDHLNFHASVAVKRLTDGDGGPVTGYAADISVKCDQCGMPFRFIGLNAGNHHSEPRVSVDGCELRAPLEPAEYDKFLSVAGYTFWAKQRHH